ncbi:hypothetical protein LS482_12195 [Sinomicrobium kalidii]|uniref:hypothetical protein n=1 Tax=Sinomicrobium kalidii TaxID=2900738 RepID=UPI001E4A79B6|nr:hypothetical protein [Sinomicrobium kalidii]UGU14461.1 hypothetical protein LS482_12195 [Sinomicrobium kalidii]
MKKYISKLLFVSLSSFILSCEGDKTVDSVYDDVTRGAILRTIEITSEETPYNYNTSSFEAGSGFTVILQEDDYEDGALLQEVRAYIRFQDNTELADSDDEGISTDDILYTTIPASEFTPDEEDMPGYTFSISVAEMIATTGIDETEVKGGDNWAVSFELELTDGRVFSRSTVGNTVSGGVFFASPFTYNVEIPCVITESLAGTHTFVTTDTFTGTSSDFPGNCSDDIITGTVTWEETATPGSYATSDLSLGLYPCWGAAPDTEDDARVIWACEGFEAERGEVTDEEGNEIEVPAYSYNITSVSGAEMTIEWSNANGEGGTTILTREDGQDWPTIFTENNN